MASGTGLAGFSPVLGRSIGDCSTPVLHFSQSGQSIPHSAGPSAPSYVQCGGCLGFGAAEATGATLAEVTGAGVALSIGAAGGGGGGGGVAPPQAFIAASSTIPNSGRIA